MPPRKSDASRRSDVSNARFMVMEEDPASTPASGPDATPTPTTTAAAAASATPSSAAKGVPTPDSAASGGKAPAPSSSSTPLTTTTVLHAGPERKETEKPPKEKSADKDALTIEDLNLPKSIITRLAKGVLPPNSQIQANAVLAMSKSATVFINYLAAHANQNTLNANKKTVSAEDVFKALDDIEFGFLREPLEQEFAKYNQIQVAKRSSYRQKVAAKKGGAAAGAAAAGVTAGGAAAAAAGADDSVLTASSAADEDGTAPRAKKARVDDSAMTVDEDADDAETEPEEEANEEDDDEEADEEEEEDEDEDEEGEGSGEDTQDALEEKEREDGADVDEALDGDESD